MRKDIDWSDLNELYVKQRLGTNKIGLLKHCAGCTVATHLRLQNIPINEDCKRKLHIDWSDLEKLYLADKLSSIEIGKLKGCTSSLVIYYLDLNGIPKRTAHQQQLISFAKTPHEHYWNWKGGLIHVNGYIYILLPSHPDANKRGYIAQHRVVMETKLGHRILKGEHVHHVNGIRDDNRPENLQLLSQADHSVKSMLCSRCEIRKEIRLLRLQVKMLTEATQSKF